MVDNKAEALKETKQFQPNTNYKRGDSIDLGGVVLWAKYNFKSTDSFDPKDWSNKNTEPKDRIVIYFNNPKFFDKPVTKEEAKPIEIDITDLVKEKLDSSDVQAIAKCFRGLIGTTENEDGTVGSYTTRASLSWDDSTNLCNNIKRISESSIVNQKQLESVNSLLSREINDFFHRAFDDIWYL